MTRVPDTDHQRTFEKTQRQIRRCTACVKAGYIDRAMPIFQGHTGQRLMVVGQAPAWRNEETPPYSGASGRRLQGWMEQAGFPPGTLHERFYLTSLTKCFPGPSKNGKGDRAPSSPEIALCRPHLDAELSFVQPEVVITLGRVSATRFLGNRPLSAIVGEQFKQEDFVVLPLPHPSGVSRWMNDPENQRRVDRALEHLSVLRQQLDL
jgi:uracil-DNA glycosylase family 4